MHVLLLILRQFLPTKKSWFIFLFAAISIAYLVYKWSVVNGSKVLPKVKFVEVHKDGSIEFEVSNVRVDFRFANIVVPKRNGKAECEREMFEIYEREVSRILKENKRSIGVVYDNVVTKKGEVLFQATTKLSEILLKEWVASDEKTTDWCYLLGKYEGAKIIASC